jgi:two-component system, chemotaxis family, response regulator WspR
MVASDHIAPADANAGVQANSQVRVLLVDDQLIIAEALRRILSEGPGITFDWASSAADALAVALRFQPTVILQDLVMPQIDGIQAVQRFRAEPHTADVPIVMLSTKEDAQVKVQSFAMGANDYLIKFPDKLELIARLRYHSAAFLSRRERDEAFRALRESEQKLAEANIKLQKLAEIDSLTGIANRRRFNDVLNTEWQRGLRNRRPLSLLLCDVDYFKSYNDTYGHLDGDRCLQQVAHLLSQNMRRPADLAARYGGEEFALILPETGSDGALAVAEACRSQIEELAIPNASAPNKLVTLSIGIVSMVPTSDQMPLSLVGIADRALYHAKQNGRNRVEVLD